MASYLRRAATLAGPGPGRHPHHYDVSNTFYEWILGPSMTYTCAVYTSGRTRSSRPSTKYDLVARKLDLKPGMRLLDVGCGWGGMVRHAAREYGVTALGRHVVVGAGRVGSADDQA